MITSFKKVSLILLAIGLASCSSESTESGNQATPTNASTQVRVVNVQSLVVKAEPFEDYLNLIGSVKASEDISLAAETSGRITQLFVSRGTRLSKGAPIAKIDDQIVSLERDRARAQHENAKENYLRRKKIWDDDRIGSELDLIAAKTSWEQAEANLKLLELQLERTTLRAPFNAVIEDIYSELGVTVAPGTPVVRLLSDATVRVKAGVPGRYAGSVKVGDKVEISFEEYQNETIEGRIAFVANSIDPQSRTFDVEVSIPNRNNKYKIDMIANVKIRTRSLSDVIVMNQEYVFRNEDGYQVFLVADDENGEAVAKSVQVKTGALFNNRVVITEGLNVGDQVITTGASSVENMTRIRVVDGSAAVAATNK
jgi:membrane fusion protein, multidrug efflux system